MKHTKCMNEVKFENVGERTTMFFHTSVDIHSWWIPEQIFLQVLYYDVYVNVFI